jgi:iron(III) transport system permease protein
MGTGLAWITTMYSFPGKTFFSRALILPIALPAYISGFTWAGILDFTSPVYLFFRENFGIHTGQYLFFDILSMQGAILIFSLALFPYVFLITRTYFAKQSSTFLEVAASLGRKPGSVFLRVALPMARPAIVAGVSLVIMEVLNDYGLVYYFGIDTFTTGIFQAWFNFGNPGSALKLSAFLMLFVFILIFTEKFQRRHMRFHSGGDQNRPVASVRLKKLSSLMAFLACFIPFLLGFLIPLSMLVYWSFLESDTWIQQRFYELMLNSFLLAGTASVLVMVAAVFIGFTVRTFPGKVIRQAAGIATLGYALPGAVVAVGILSALLSLDALLVSWLPFRMILTGTWYALVFAYVVRFLTVGYNSISSGFEGISPAMDETSRSLGRSDRGTLWHINLPLLKGSLLAGFLLVFIDTLKELPLTLILRPFNFDTLAIRAFEFASDERIAEAAPAAVIILIIGILPVMLLHKISGKEKR